MKRVAMISAAAVAAAALFSGSPATATSHTTDLRCDAPASGSVYRECINASGFTDSNGDGLPDGRWIEGVEGNQNGSDGSTYFGDSEYDQWVSSDGLSKHRIIPGHSPAKGDVGIVRSFPVWNTGEVYQACALAKVYEETGEDGNEMNFVARLTVAQKKDDAQVGNPEEHNSKIQWYETDFREFATKPFKIASSEANNIAVKFRAHSDTSGSGGVAVVKAIKFLRFANGSTRTVPVDCFPTYPYADSEYRNP